MIILMNIHDALNNICIIDYKSSCQPLILLMVIISIKIARFPTWLHLADLNKIE
jgi:hypothetical protein